MNIERIINWTEKSISHRDSASLSYKMLTEILDILNECQKREQGCEYCNPEVMDGNPIFSKHADNYIGNGKFSEAGIKANVCPNCGRNLTQEAEKKEPLSLSHRVALDIIACNENLLRLHNEHRIQLSENELTELNQSLVVERKILSGKDVTANAITALKTTDQIDKPLTLKQLRQRDETPVYCVGIKNKDLDGWGLVCSNEDEIMDSHCDCWQFDEYGITYVAYSQEPKPKEIKK